MNTRQLYNRLQRFRLPIGSLRTQLAIASAVVALAAVLMVTLAAALSLSISFGQYRRNQLSTEVHQLASLIEQRASEMNTSASAELSASILLIRPTRSGQFQQENLWTMDQEGNVLYSPPIGHRSGQVSPSDAREIATALYAALRGHSSEGSLPYTPIPWLSQRYFAAAPIQLSSSPGAPIIGSVALSSLPRADLGVAFYSNIRTTLFLTGLATALLAALGAIVFSRRLTSPLDHLAAATTRMTGGDYSARVDVSAPDELRRLATTFNEMAAALECDVNELHRQERLRRELIANISHELATPLTAIQGYTEALADGVINDPAGREESNRMIAREAARLRRLVDQLRQVALFEAGAQRLDVAPLELAPVVSDTLEVLAPALERKHVTVVNSVRSDLPIVNADSDRLIEILLNLFDNALRHTPDDGQIRVSASRDGRFVRVSISDTGVGITPEDRDRIFDRFYRLDTSRSTETGGSGLGLSIVRALVEAHGGRIQAGAAQDGGAEFTFTLPVAANDQRIADSTAPVPALR
jgi:two-component system, OmpR family, sensor histidine kinase BaeS